MNKFIYIFFIFFFLCFNSEAIEDYKLTDITDGSENAKIKIYAYQSLTCPHCADFHDEVYPLLKKDYIDKGLVKIYFKHFPLDYAALNAAKISQCINKEKRISFLSYLYENQEMWIKGKKIEDINQNLKGYVKKFGLSDEDFDRCLNFEDVENFVLNTRIEAAKKFEVKSTPAIVINDKMYKDAVKYDKLKKIIEKLI